MAKKLHGAAAKAHARVQKSGSKTSPKKSMPASLAKKLGRKQ